MNHQIELRLAEGIRHTSRDVILPPGLSVEQWLDYGRFCRTARQAVVFWETRWLSYGRTNFGDETVGAAAKQLAFEFSELKAMEALNKLEVRDADFSAEHHFVLAKASLPASDQQAWLETSQREKLTPAELQLSIRRGLVTRIVRQESDPSAGVPTFQGLRGQWDLLRRQVDRTLAEWTADDVRQALEMLAPIGEFIAELKARV